MSTTRPWWGGPQSPILERPMSQQAFSTWEVDIQALDRVVPSALEPVELRPGVGLLSLALVRYMPGLYGVDSPAFDEVSLSVHVQADLSVEMPLPRFALYATQVWANCEAFCAQETGLLSVPAHYRPSLRLEFDAQGGAAALDDDGTIAELRRPSAVPEHSPASLWGQHFNGTDLIRQGVWQWEGALLELMGPDVRGAIHGHPFLGSIPSDAVLDCYHQMHTRPGEPSTERFFSMRTLG